LATLVDITRAGHTSSLQLAEEFLGRRFIATPLHENVQDMAILIDRSPQIMTLTLD
jgi:hypothetical protein